MSDDGPPLLRPIPRRPFEISLMSATSPDDDSAPPSPTSYDDENRFLDPRAFNFQDGSISRDASYKNLTSSTLSGIYSPNISGYPASEGIYGQEAPDTPWGTGAETPTTAVRGTVDESIYKLVKDRSSLLRRRRSSAVSCRSGHGVPQASSLSLGLRTGLLYFLGMGYGALLSRLSTEQKWASLPVDGVIINSGYGSRYLACWGICGVVLGSLLPWLDGMWEQASENADDNEEACNLEADPGTDWALVVRGIGAFAGIVLAIRKVPWASTMQVSMTLAMVNPFLWYLIDRSKPGFLLSAAVGLAGSVILMGLNPEIMPTPAGYSSDYLGRNSTGQADAESLMLGGLATQRTIETGIWMLSVLFCSCVCFGNIGRRLALNRSAAGRGRWGGLR